MIGPTNAVTVTGTIDPSSVTVGSDTKPIKLVSGVATAVTNDLVDVVSNQNIGGLKALTGTLDTSRAIVNNGYNNVKYPSNGKAIKVFELNTSIYTGQYHQVTLSFSARRSNIASKMYIGNGIATLYSNTNGTPRMMWLTRGKNVNVNNFVVTREGALFTMWLLNVDSEQVEDGYNINKIVETRTAGPTMGLMAATDTNEYEITSSGYTDIGGVAHTFDGYSVSGDINDTTIQSALDNYTPMVRTTGNQTIAGDKTFTNNITINSQFPRYIFKMSDVDITTPTDLLDRGNIRWVDKNGTEIGLLRFNVFNDGTTQIQAKVRNSDGTFKYLSLAKGDVI